VAAGESLLSPTATRILKSRFLNQPAPGPAHAPEAMKGLTPREKEIVALVAVGSSNDQIAERLYLSPLTAKTHINNAMGKAGARDRAQLVVLTYQSGLVQARDLPIRPECLPGNWWVSIGGAAPLADIGRALR
jgi:DNA-binding NarL/FixJ family response regulator